MSSRDAILSAVKNNQPAFVAAPAIPRFEQGDASLVEKYTQVLQSIGGKVHYVENYDEIIQILKAGVDDAARIVSSLPYLSSIAENYSKDEDPHSFKNIELFIMESPLAIAENGAIWITDNQVPQRVLPFITQHLAVIISSKNILATMHDAYDVIAATDYGFATFIAGPSKTADIEQSLVLGAHGPKTMTVFIV
jgi:L-lactate dehydrogenase complex protein LldG